jgi:catechol 2,3-dioxygenase-like lactoylglutathione lyase family enzyme
MNHLALITNDLDTTTRFWHGTLGAPLVATIGTPEFRHYFFDTGSSCVAFFEYRNEPSGTLAKPAGVPDARAMAFDHMSLNMPDEAAVLELKARLEAFGTEVTTVIDHGLMHSIYFMDPNGIALEASWWTDDPTNGQSDERHFGDPDPVPAVEEIRSGTLRSVSTRLIDGPTTDVGDLWYLRPSDQ